MFNLKLLAIVVAACVLAPPIYAQTRWGDYGDYPVKGGVTLRARAYTDYSGALKYASRYYLQIAKTPADGYKWDFTLDDDPNYHYTGSINGAFAPSYNNKPTATLRATLHQYDVYEERVTFKDLHLGPIHPTEPGLYPGFSARSTPRYLDLREPQTVVTPSGISVTLPRQGAQTLRELFTINGNTNALFFKIDISPDKREVILPDSPLYQKHPLPVTVKLETPNPNLMVWYMADNTFKTLAIGYPNLKTLQHLDTLTLILRQRVELQTIPVSIEVPVQRKTKNR